MEHIEPNQLDQELQIAPPEPERPMIDMFYPTKFEIAIGGPEITASSYELKPGLINLVQQSSFSGKATEDPYDHLEYFLDLCNTVRYEGVPDEAIRFRLFPFSLRGKAKDWYRSFITDGEKWDVLVRNFLQEFFPPRVVMKLIREIATFRQREEETMKEAWDRFKSMLRKCPNHGFGRGDQVGHFYYGCTVEDQERMDTCAGGSIYAREANAAYKIIENIASNTYTSRERQILKPVTTTTETDAMMKLIAQNISEINSHLESNVQASQTRIDKLEREVEILATRLTLLATTLNEQTMKFNDEETSRFDEIQVISPEIGYVNL